MQRFVEPEKWVDDEEDERTELNQVLRDLQDTLGRVETAVAEPQIPPKSVNDDDKEQELIKLLQDNKNTGTAAPDLSLDPAVQVPNSYPIPNTNQVSNTNQVPNADPVTNADPGQSENQVPSVNQEPNADQITYAANANEPSNSKSNEAQDTAPLNADGDKPSGANKTAIHETMKRLMTDMSDLEKLVQVDAKTNPKAEQLRERILELAVSLLIY